MTTSNRSFKELRRLPENATLEEVIEFYNEMVFDLNDVFRTLNVASLNGEIITTVLSPGQNTISHKLGVAPLHKVTLKLVGGDGFVKDLEFNIDNVKLENTGTSNLEITFILVKG